MQYTTQKLPRIALFFTMFVAWTAQATQTENPKLPKAKACPQLVYSASGNYHEVQIAASLRRFSRVPLIRELQKRSVVRDAQLGRFQWSAFDRRFMFNDPEAMGLLISGHPEEYKLVPHLLPAVKPGSRGRPRVLPQYEGIEAFVDRMLEDHLRAGGLVSEAWEGVSYSAVEKRQVTGRRRFIKRLILELAFVYQTDHGVVPGEQPVHFTRSQTDLNWSMLPQYAEMVKFFGDEQKFQNEYRDFARPRLGVRTPYQKWKGLPSVLAANRVLKAAGQSPVSAGNPIKAEDQATRERREIVESAVSLIVLVGDKRVPLTAISNAESGVGDLHHAATVLQDLENIADHFEGLNAFVDVLNGVLGPKFVVTKREGVHSWAMEWLVQEGVAHARALGFTARKFPGFQSADPDEPNFVAGGSYLFLEAQRGAPRQGFLFLVDLNDKIRQRLPAR
jgi:hypothetical protein